MRLTVPQLKSITKLLTDNGYTEKQAGEILKSSDDNIIQSLLAGDLSGLKSSLCASVGASGSSCDKIPADDLSDDTRQDTINNKVVQNSKTGSCETIAAENKNVLHYKDKQTAAGVSAAPLSVSSDNTSDDIIQPSARDLITGDIIQADINERLQLPADTASYIKELLKDYCIEYKIDDPRKMPGRVWRGFCLFVGRWVKSTRLLYDEEKLKRNGGSFAYIPQRVEALFNIWQDITTAYDKTPLPHDFAAFAGVSIDYILEKQDGLTSASIGLQKKLSDTMHAGLLSHGADGRHNSIFDIFLLKSKFGYIETSQVVHTSAAASVGAGDLPMLGDNSSV